MAAIKYYRATLAVSSPTLSVLPGQIVGLTTAQAKTIPGLVSAPKPPVAIVDNDDDDDDVSGLLARFEAHQSDPVLEEPDSEGRGIDGDGEVTSDA